MLIGLNGQIGSGKDSVFERAYHLMNTSGTRTVLPERVAFADKLKRAIEALFNVSPQFIEEAKRDDECLVQIRRPRFALSRRWGLRWTRVLPGMTEVVSSHTVRAILQRMGTEVGRNVFGDNFWVDQAVPADLDHEGRAVFVTDCRFPNEIDRIHEAGGLVVRVLNGPLGAAGHASEQVIDSSLIDVEMDNSARDDNWRSLDAKVMALMATAVPPAEKPKVNALPNRVIGPDIPLAALQPTWAEGVTFEGKSDDGE